MNVRSKVAMVMAEFLGTAILTTSAINVARSQIGIGYFVAFSVAITVGVLTLIFNATSGAHFNPAITIGMWTLRKIKTLQAIVAVAAQMLGGFAAWKLAEYFTGQTLANIAGKTFSWKVLVAEALGTFVLTFGIAAAIYQKYEGSKLAVTVAASMFAGIIVASLAANGALNPALALGNQSWGRAYIFGPIIGSVVGMNLYAMLFAPTKMLVANTSDTVAPETIVTVSSSRKPAAKKKAAPRRKK
jgi:glycerol uptake facilitator-like aquaporin